VPFEEVAEIQATDEINLKKRRTSQ